MTEQWMCNLCFPEYEELVTDFAETSVIKDPHGGIHLLGGQGHRDDEVVSWNVLLPPMKDGLWDIPDEDEAWDEWLCNPDNEAESDLFTETASMMTYNFDSIIESWYFVEQLRKMGYDPAENGSVDFWLTHKVAVAIEEAEEENA